MAEEHERDAAGPSAPWKARQVSSRTFSKSYGSGPQVVSIRPELAQRFGQIITCWSAIEHELTEAFAYLIEAEGWSAAEIFGEIRKLRPRIQIMLNYIRIKAGAENEAFAKSVLMPLLELSVERDKIAHGFFIVPHDHPDALIRKEGWGVREKWYLYDKATLDALVEQFYAKTQAVSDLCFHIMMISPPRAEPGRVVPAQLLGVPPRHPRPTEDPGDTPPPAPGSPDRSDGEPTPG